MLSCISGANLWSMKLIDYLDSSKISQATFARQIGVTQGRVSQWLSGDAIPAERCVAVERITNGAVSRVDLRPDIFGDNPKREAA